MQTSPTRIVLRALLIGVALAWAAGAASATAQPQSAADLLPASTLVYIQIEHPKDVIALLLDEPLGKQLASSPQFHQALQTPQFRQFRAVVALVEKRAGVRWREALESITANGLAVAFDPRSQGVVLLAKPDEPKTAEAVRDAFFSLARDDARNKGKPDPIESTTYRGLSAYKSGEAVIGNLGPWLLISNKPDLAKAVADVFLDGGKTLAEDHDFIEAHHSNDADVQSASVWGFVRLAGLRAMAANQPLLDPKNKSGNPGAEFLLGGLATTLQKAPYLTVSLELDSKGLRLALAAPHDPAWVAPERKFFFAPSGDGAPRPLHPRNMLLTACLYRDLSAMWQSGPDLFTEAVATQMAQTDSGLSTIFGGKSFSTDVLGAIKPQMQLVVAAQDYNFAGVHPPQIRLPGFALVLRIKPEQFAAVRKHFRVGFQSVIAFSNLDGSSKGRPLLEIQTEKRAGAEIQFATYAAADDDATKDQKMAAKAKGPQADIYLNFSPALVMSNDYMILCSTKQLAEELADLTAKESGQDPTIPENTAIEIIARPVAELIHENRDQLVVQNMLEKGHDRAAAEKEIGLLESLVGYFENAKIRLAPTDKSIRLEVELKAASVQ